MSTYFGRPFKSTHVLLLSAVALLLSVLIYVLFRSRSLLLYQWLGIQGYINNFNFYAKLPALIKYSLPDALWAFSFLSLIGYCCEYFRQPLNLYYSAIGMISLSEILQISVIPGTFDPYDLLAYFISTFLSYLLIKSQTNEKPEI